MDMNNYKNLFLDISKFNEENISYIKPILFYKVSRNIGVYYKKENTKTIKSDTNDKKNKKKLPNKKTESDSQVIVKNKKQKIIVQTPKMLVPFGVKEFDNNGRKSYQMCISFSTLTNLYNEEEIKKFYTFIKKIDGINEETIMDYKKDWGLPKNLKYKKILQRLSKDFPFHMNLSLPHDEKIGFLFNTYDESAQKSNIEIIEKRSIVSVVMELTDLRFTDTDFRAHWTVMQIRKFKPYSPIQEFFMSGCYICDEDDPEDTAYAQIIENYRKKLATPMPLPMIPQMNPNYMQMMMAYMNTGMQYPMQNNNQFMPPPPPLIKSAQPEPQTSGFKPPSLEELLSAKKSLKKTKTVVKVKPAGKVIDDDNIKNKNVVEPPPPPPMPTEKIKKTKSDEKKIKSDDKKGKTQSDDKKKIIKPDKKEESESKSDSDSDTDNKRPRKLTMEQKKKLLPHIKKPIKPKNKKPTNREK